MTKGLKNFEIDFMKDIRNIDTARRQKAGALLPIIPNHVNWDDFLATVKAEWWAWGRSSGNLERYPNCLVVLYGGLAFYEYDENTFWPQFAKAVGQDLLPTNRQHEINMAFSNASQNLGLKILQQESKTFYVGSAVYHIGIPLSLWDGFLAICEWALWQNDWKMLSEEEWAESIGGRAGGRVRLKRFLIGNRETTTAFIQEMLDAREKLTKDVNLTVDKIAQASLLRIEYFDEVPETAEFLRPKAPDSLFEDRARLFWNEQRGINLHLPGVNRDKLPATWRVGKLTQEAASTPDELTLNSAAFDDPLLLKLESGQRSEAQRLRGLNIWGLFDLERGRFINREREWLPLGSYVLISSEKFDNILRKGFDEEEYPANDPYELEDGTTCFVTRLWPTDKYGTLSLTQGEKTWELNFRPSAKIEARFFIEEGAYASNFSRIKGLIRIEELPILCVAIPFGYFINTESVLKSKFQVFVDEMPGYGQWERRHADDDREFYIWRWANRPVMKESPPCNLNSFKKVNLKDFEPPDLTGRRTISIKAPELGFKFEYQVEILKRQPNIDWCWNNLPGDYLLWFLLEQSTEGMKWDDLLLAKDIIAPNSKLSYLLLREYAKYGLIRRQGQIWQIAESRAVLKRLSTSDLNMQFCGKPSVLWGLIRYMRDSIIRKKTQKKTPHQYGFRHIPSLSYSLPLIQVVNDKDELPFLLMRFRENSKGQVEDYLRWHNVRIVSNLWRC